MPTYLSAEFERSSEEDDMVAEALNESVASSDGWRRANCPFCIVNGEPKPDTHMSWGVDTASGYWHCFRCGAKGIYVPFAVEGAAAAQMIAKIGEGLGGAAGVPVLGAGDMLHPAEYMDPPEGFLSLSGPDGGAMVLARAREYLTKRGISPEQISAAGVGACVSGFYVDRIVVPVRARNSSRWLGFVARSYLTAGEQAKIEAAGHRFMRYLYPRWPNRGKCLLNERALDARTERPVMAVEGSFDALPYWPDVVAFLGKPSRDHVRLLKASKRPVAVCLDGDAAAESEALARTLALEGVKVGWVRLPPKEDPCSVDRAWLREAADNCIGNTGAPAMVPLAPPARTVSRVWLSRNVVPHADPGRIVLAADPKALLIESGLPAAGM